MNNVFIVVPTIRKLAFLKDWGGEFSGTHLIVVEDGPKKSVTVPGPEAFRSIHHVAWPDIRADLGEDEWIFPRHNAGIRSYGFWKAYQLGADMVITIDDDCYPAEPGFVDKHAANLSIKATGPWFTTFPHPDYMYTRGFPYDVRNGHRAVISHGLWSNKMDLDAKTQLATGDVNVPPYPPFRQVVPSGYYFPMSSMNLAFVRKVIPLMYFPLMGNDPEGRPWGFDRYDDIWAGIIAKKICDHLRLAVVNGSPFVEHRKQSDPRANAVKERPGMRENELFWKRVDAVTLHGSTLAACYRELWGGVRLPDTRYFKAARTAALKWISLFAS